MNYTTYRVTDGSVLRQLSCRATEVANQLLGDESFVEGRYAADAYYVLDGTPTAKGTMTPTVVDLTISDLPVPCTATVDGVTYDVADGEVTFDFGGVPGTYAVTLRAVPYLDYTVELTV